MRPIVWAQTPTVVKPSDISKLTDTVHALDLFWFKTNMPPRIFRTEDSSQ
jgi:hypothetical protein